MGFRRRVLLFWAFLFTPFLASAQTVQTADWKQSLAGGVGTALTRAPNGDVITVGIESPSAYDRAYGATLTLQRFSSNGAVVWAAPVRWTSIAAGVRPTALAVDASGNAFVMAAVGDFNFPLCVPEASPCTGPITIFNAWWLVQKYSPAGALLWERRQLQVGFVPSGGVVDAAGDLYFALDPNSGGRSAVALKLSGATGATLWSVTTIDGAKPAAPALTSQGTVVLAGAGVLGLSINEFASSDGVRLTRTTYPAAAGYYTPGVALGPQGEIAVTGSSAAGLFLALESASRQPLFALSTTVGAEGRRVAIDGLGNLTVAGPVAGSIGTNWLLARFDGAGAPLHAPVVFDRHSSATETPLDVVVTSDGAAYVTGAAGPGTSTDPAATQAVTLRLAVNGSIDWVASDAAGVRGLDAEAAASGGVTVLMAGELGVAHYKASAVVPPTPTSLTLSTTSTRGGNRVTGRVTLASNLGAVVSVKSSNTNVATVPATVTVPAGQTAASFTITTKKVRANTAVTITVTANGVSRSVMLTVFR